MKHLILLASFFCLVTTTQAAEKSPKRKIAQSGSAIVCSKEAGKVAVNIAKAVGREVRVQKITHLQSNEDNSVVFNVKLESKNGASSPETNDIFMIYLYDNGEACTFKSASLESSAG